MIGLIQHPNPVFIMLMGLPAAGKSTVRATLPSEYMQLSTDDIIEDVAQWQGKTYSDVFADEIKAATATVHAAFAQGLKDRTSMVWDQTNLSAKKRRGILSQVPADYYKVLVEVTCEDEKVHAERLRSRPGKHIPAHIMDNMRDMRTQPYNWPTKAEGWDEIWTLRT